MSKHVYPDKVEKSFRRRVGHGFDGPEVGEHCSDLGGAYIKAPQMYSDAISVGTCSQHSTAWSPFLLPNHIMRPGARAAVVGLFSTSSLLHCKLMLLSLKGPALFAFYYACGA